jgi:hypothetical protein
MLDPRRGRHHPRDTDATTSCAAATPAPASNRLIPGHFETPRQIGQVRVPASRNIIRINS